MGGADDEDLYGEEYVDLEGMQDELKLDNIGFARGNEIKFGLVEANRPSKTKKDKRNYDLADSDDLFLG